MSRKKLYEWKIYRPALCKKKLLVSLSQLDIEYEYLLCFFLLMKYVPTSGTVAQKRISIILENKQREKYII